jgi:hypothetical protein
VRLSFGNASYNSIHISSELSSLTNPPKTGPGSFQNHFGKGANCVMKFPYNLGSTRRACLINRDTNKSTPTENIFCASLNPFPRSQIIILLLGWGIFEDFLPNIDDIFRRFSSHFRRYFRRFSPV